MATVNIQKRKRKNRNSYLVYYKDPFTGKKKYYKTYQKLKDAQRVANDLRTLLDSGKLPDSNKNKIRMLTFEAAAEELKKSWMSRLATGEIVQKTLDVYVYTLDSVSKTFGPILLCEITEDQIKSYREAVVSELSNLSSNRRLSTIKQVFEVGIKLNAIFENPAKNLKKLSEKDHERNRFIFAPDICRLVEASQKNRGKYYLPALIFLGAEHGASKQEALSLKWSDINFDYEGIGLIRFYRTKNQTERTEYLMPQSKQALLDWKKHQELMRHRKKIKSNSSDIVFSHLDGSQLQSFAKAWTAICTEANIEDFHYHDLRHTFCSNLILSGAGIKDVKEMIGHRDIAMTDRYSHLTIGHKQVRQQQLSEFYAKQSAEAL